VLLGCCALLGTTAVAQARQADPPRPRRVKHIGVVLLLEKKDPKATASLVQAIRSQLADTAVRLDLQTVDRFASELSRQLALARRTATTLRSNMVIWFSLSRREPLYLYFVEKHGVRLIMRSFGEMESDERAEAAAIVVRSSVLAFLRGQRVGRKIAGPTPTVRSRRPPPGSPAPPPGSKPRPKPWPRHRPAKIWTSLELGYAYAYDDWDAGLTGHHGLMARIALHLTPRWSLLAGYRYSGLAALHDSTDSAEVLLRLHRVFGGARFRHGLGRWHLGASLWLNADYVSYTVREDALVEQHDGPALVLFSLAPTFHVGLRLVQRLRLQLDVGVEVGLYNPTLWLETPGQPNEFSKFGKPEVIRPSLMLTLAVDLM